MDPYVSEWVNLLLRWFHVFAAILWIGSTAFFSWLDARLTAEVDPATGKERIWMVHSGGFYIVDKQRVPQGIPATLHWFKWEAFFTWLTGFLLLGTVYYMGGNLLDQTEVPVMSKRAAIGLGIGALFAGWVAYDLIWISPLRKNELVASAICLALLLAATHGLSLVFTPRAAFFHAGAIMGTIMTANVWMRIIPAQRRMVEATRAGREPDMTEGVRAKSRSKHNTFMALPVLAIMLGNHFPIAAYSSPVALRVAIFLAIGFAVRKGINMHNARKPKAAA